MTSTTSQISRTPAALLNVTGLVVAAAGIMIQYAAGVDFPTIPPGPIILLVAAAVVAFGPWHWSPIVGLVAAAFVSVGGAIATIAGNGFNDTLGDPRELAALVGAAVQIAGLAIALPAGIVNVRDNGRGDRRREPVAGRGRASAPVNS
jgi:hypothetical protein